ncbi:MAG TPA: hypothetical protein VGP08_10840 [Pyrinomonadaceae bacterium]|jgi:hypothetical protein|nr:hypothetical protein [Pyrinomonadaceae bacterium]
MKSVFTLKRSVTSFVALAVLLVIAPTARASSSGAKNREIHSSSSSQRQSDARGEGTYPFEFHSGFWLNLHHFLYEQALLRKRAGGPGQTESWAASPEGKLSPEQQRLWDAAVDYYAGALIKRDFVFDEGMIEMNDRLAESEMSPDLSKSRLDGDLVKILESVAPTYRALWWPKHDRANRFWVAAVTPLVQQFGRTLIKDLSAAYKAKWPSEVIRVDVAEYANWAGAYTTFGSGEKVHTTLCSTDSGNQSFAALELLFHEASHWMVGPRNGSVARAISREARAKNKQGPKDLWHAIIFYTAGELTRRNLNDYGVSDYTPIAYRGLYARAWPNLQRPLELYWQPYLEGKVEFDKAVANLIDAL